MKNQYFGDVNDYRKYGLLRALQSNGDSSLLVVWMLTPDDGSRDGSFRSYLDIPAKWESYDPDLFAGLCSLLRGASQRSVSAIEGTALLPGARYYSAVVPDRRGERVVWRDGLLRTASGIELVFLDPDNGIEVPSRPVGRKGSSKYVMWDEIELLWTAGSSILIYQHFTRRPRVAFAKGMVEALRLRTGARFVEAFRTPHVLFLLVAQDQHAKRLVGSIPLISERWRTQITSMELI